MRKMYYLSYIIFETLIEQLIPVALDMSEHLTLVSAQHHIDYLTK